MRFCLVAVALLAFGQPRSIEVAKSPTFTEGPVLDRDGNLFFSHNHGIFKLAPGRKPVEWITDSEAGFNGHKIVSDGSHLVCASKKGAIWRLDSSGRLIGAVSTESEGKPLRAPNDLTLDEHGGFYFTDPGGSREAPIGTVHYVDRSGRTFLSAGGLRVPNGLVADPARRILYVAETVPNRILKFKILSPGKLGPMEVLAVLPSREGHEAAPDGLALDPAGRIYAAHLGTGNVLVLDPRGKLLHTWTTGMYDVSNLVFDRGSARLFVTGSVGHRRNTEGRVVRLDLPR